MEKSHTKCALCGKRIISADETIKKSIMQGERDAEKALVKHK
jgi:hypothetical protein